MELNSSSSNGLSFIVFVHEVTFNEHKTFKRETKLDEKSHFEAALRAVVYHINIETLRKWGQGQRDPDSISRAYLTCIQNDPVLIKELVNK